jgi:iron complex outermembrane receptor protein
MSFSNMEMIHLYIYFKQENAKKNLYFFFSVFFAVFVLRKTQLRKITTKEECLFRKSCAYWEKTVSSDVSGNYLVKRLPSGNAKIFVSIGFQPVDTLVNIAFDKF